MNVIKTEDLQVLSSYSFVEQESNRRNTHLLGVKWIKEDSKWTQRLVEVNKYDVTCWTLFLSLFGTGKLKHTSASLTKVYLYLYQYQWSEIKLRLNQDKESPEYRAFKTVCHVANRYVQFHSSLFSRVSDVSSEGFCHCWNPAMNGRFLQRLHQFYLPTARNLELRFKDSKAVVPPYQQLTLNDMGTIEVGYSYEKVSSGDDHHFHYPEPPYYSTGHQPCRSQRPSRNVI